mgnify:CR=1 FL=1
MTNIQHIITELKIPNKIVEIDSKQFQKMVFLMNAIDDGWSVKKTENRYIFSKKHENKKEVYDKTYLEKFILTSQELQSI